MLHAKPSSILFEVNMKMLHSVENLLLDPIIYRQLIGKLMYIQLTRLYIVYSVCILFHFMDKPSQAHLNVACKVLKYLKNAPGHSLF